MEQKLNKGPWSKQEDEILIEYVNRYGSKNWNNVPRFTGLPRDGRSCRFRWLNQLNPCLKKGRYSEEEKQKILQLRDQLNCSWAEIAKQIPGRTDNEVKNIWYSNERKKHKMEMENVKEECRKKKKKLNHSPLNDEIKKPHGNELNDNGESNLSGVMSNQQQDISGTHERELMKDSFHIPIMQPSNTLLCNVASTSISQNSSPTFIDRGEAPFMPSNMLSDLPPLIEIESPLPSYTYESNISSPTFIERDETSFASMDMISEYLALFPLPESIDFQSLDSPLIDKYPPLPLRSPEEIRQEQLEQDYPPNNGFLVAEEDGNKPISLEKDESKNEDLIDLFDPNNGFLVVEENGNKPISLEKDESKNEDLIDLIDSLDWLDGYIF
ncbi:transcription factor MYB14 [Trifolium repens]|nr:transcription factor MYB14 [Trifolium repens]